MLAVAPSPAAAPGDLTRYPYLTDLTAGGVAVNWATGAADTTASVRYGPAGGSCDQFETRATGVAIEVRGVSERQWTAELRHLTPGVSYCYRVRADGADLLGSDPSPTFDAGLPVKDEAFKFAVFGDTGFAGPDGDNADQSRLFARIAASGARFALFTGDVPYSPGESSQDGYGDLSSGSGSMFAPASWSVAGRSMPLFLALGNHGLDPSFLVNWPEPSVAGASGGRFRLDSYSGDGIARRAPSAWYAFDAGGARFYVLDAAWGDSNSNPNVTAYRADFDFHWDSSRPAGCSPIPCGSEYRWLAKDLAAHRTQLKFAVFHYPLYSDNSSERSDAYLQGARRLEGLLGRSGVRLVFNGHAHMYERNASHLGVTSYITGGGGARLEAPTACSSFDRYSIGWSYPKAVGRACRAPVPASIDHAFHFLLVSVAGRKVTVAPTDELGRTFDVKSYSFS